MSRGLQIIILLGAVVLLIGAMLPWISIVTSDDTVITGGYEGDRLITGSVGAAILLGMFALKSKSRLHFIVASVLALIAVGIVVRDWLTIRTILARAADGGVNTDGIIVTAGSVGVGIYVSLVGSVLALIGGLLRVLVGE